MVSPRLAHNGAVLEARFSTDRRRVLTASRDGAARVWDAASGQLVAGPFQDNAWMLDAVFSPDDARVATACANGQVRIWDARTGQPLSVPLDHGLVYLGGDDSTKATSAHALPRYREVIMTSNDPDPYARWARWFFADRATRTISANSKVSVDFQRDERR